jgi:hypothetical protein
MPRPPKNKLIEPPKPVAPAPAPAPVMIPVIPAPPTSKVGPVIDVDNFIRVRDSVSSPFFSAQDSPPPISSPTLVVVGVVFGYPGMIVHRPIYQIAMAAGAPFSDGMSLGSGLPWAMPTRHGLIATRFLLHISATPPLFTIRNASPPANVPRSTNVSPPSRI